MSDNDPLIAPGCEIAIIPCGDSDCACEMARYCATHQDAGDDWPCDPQVEYEGTSEYRFHYLAQQIDKLSKVLTGLAENHERLARDHARLTRITEHGLIPFMRDALPQIGGKMQISWGVGDTESLLGCDIADGVTTFNRGRAPGSSYGITYEASDGTHWVNGVPGAKQLPEDKLRKAKGCTHPAEEPCFPPPRRNHGSDG